MPRPSTLRIADLSTRRPTEFALKPTAEDLEKLARSLDVSAIRKLSFTGTLSPLNSADWRLEATLGATIVQPCVVTLDPVTTRIDEPVTRTYTPHMPDLPDAAGAEVEMPEDDTLEPLTETIDLAAIMEEALALSIPAYPRKDGAETGEAVFTKPGATPLTDDDVKPFAGLADLKAKMGGSD
ncbi:YceD family protein [Aestuariibius sp. 2305UL40-4]|uniref:YceD family protein n=1 Tax=Aestuariibius violaceus TaxID=3234132 RepID=UPI00345EABF3